MTSIMSRSHGRRSWSIIRSQPTAAKRRTASRALLAVPLIQRSPRSASQSPSPDRHRRPSLSFAARDAPIDLGLIATDQHARHHRPGQRRRIATDRPARLVDRGISSRCVLGPVAVEVELVGVLGGEAVRPRRSRPADEKARPGATDRRPRPARARRPASGRSAPP